MDAGKDPLKFIETNANRGGTFEMTMNEIATHVPNRQAEVRAA